MKPLRLFAAALVFAATVSSAFAAPEKVSYKSGDETVQAQLFLPTTPGRHPALVLVHEWWGVTPWVEQQAQDLADHGFAALVVDLYRGKSTDNPEVAHELMRGLPEDRAMRDMDAAVNYLRARPEIEKFHIGAEGWCMGGGFALKLALANHNITAVVVNYGALPTDKVAIGNMTAAVLGNFGGQDHGITPDDVKAFEQILRSFGKSPDIKIYPDAGHAFENPGNKDGYRAADAADAHARTLAFLNRNLK
jgi:carboxymethylenebutenolidase